MKMTEERTTISVTQDVWWKLFYLKKEHKDKSFSETLERLLKNKKIKKGLMKND